MSHHDKFNDLGYTSLKKECPYTQRSIYYFCKKRLQISELLHSTSLEAKLPHLQKREKKWIIYNVDTYDILMVMIKKIVHVKQSYVHIKEE